MIEEGHKSDNVVEGVGDQGWSAHGVEEIELITTW
jgi:hypothetical protein